VLVDLGVADSLKNDIEGKIKGEFEYFKVVRPHFIVKDKGNYHLYHTDDLSLGVSFTVIINEPSVPWRRSAKATTSFIEQLQ
jgi:hypothetical protein